MDNKIGIGVTTTGNRRNHFDLWVNQVAGLGLFDKMSYSKDFDTIAKAKNNNLNDLKDCDYIFLFDDDCFPIKEGWAEFFIEHHKRTGNHHFLYLNHTHRPINVIDGIGSYLNCGGCFMFLTKEVINKVGYFYDKYEKYGYEHAGYSNRIHQAGLTPSGMCLCPEGSNQYIHSLDLDLKKFDIDHTPSLNVHEVLKHSTANQQLYKEDIKEIYRPYLTV